MVSLKLLIDKKSERVVFAEAGQDFVDFIFTLLELPIGPVIKLLNCNENTVDFVGNIYQSISDFRNDHLQYDQEVGSKRKHSHFTSYSLVGDDWWSPPPTPTTAKFYYTCGGCTDSILSPVADGVCNKCRTTMDKIVTHYVIPTISTKAPVNASPTKASCNNAPEVHDNGHDLVVYSLVLQHIKLLLLLQQVTSKRRSCLIRWERDVHKSMDEGFKLLKHALGSKTVLTDLFLATKG
ncbi:hypothetical protein Tco_1382711 [Tanacetum coccineum]